MKKFGILALIGAAIYGALPYIRQAASRNPASVSDTAQGSNSVMSRGRQELKIGGDIAFEGEQLANHLLKDTRYTNMFQPAQIQQIARCSMETASREMSIAAFKQGIVQREKNSTRIFRDCVKLAKEGNTAKTAEISTPEVPAPTDIAADAPVQDPSMTEGPLNQAALATPEMAMLSLQPPAGFNPAAAPVDTADMSQVPELGNPQ